MAQKKLKIRQPAPEQASFDDPVTERLEEIEQAVVNLERKAQRLDSERHAYRDAVTSLRETLIRTLNALDAVSFHTELREEIEALRAAHRKLLADVSGEAEANHPAPDDSPTVDDLNFDNVVATASAQATGEYYPTVDEMSPDDAADNATTVDDLRLSEVYRSGHSTTTHKGPPRSAAGRRCKDQLKALLAAAERLQQSRRMPRSGEVIDMQLLAELNDRCLNVLEEFLTVHDENKRSARRIYDSEPRNVQNAKVTEFWTGAPAEQYRHYRSQAVIDTVFDFLEDQILEFRAYSYFELIDYLAAAVNLERIAPRPGDPFDEVQYKTNGMAPAPGCAIKELISCGYLDLEDEMPVRRATVSVDPPRKAAALTKNREQDAGHDAPTHPEIERCQKKVIGLKLALLKMLNDNNSELHRPVPTEVKAAVNSKCAAYHKEFRALHMKFREQAQQRFERIRQQVGAYDYDMFWDDEAVASYRRFASLGFIEQVLDPVEDQIMAGGHPESSLVLDLLAHEMDLVRLPVKPGQTKFDPIVHDGPAAKRSGALIRSLDRSGYEATDGERLYRKASVKV